HHSQGIPRKVNLLCGHALAAAGSLSASHITARMISDAAEKMPFPDGRPPGSRPRLHPPASTPSASTPTMSLHPAAQGAKPRTQPSVPASATASRDATPATQQATDWPVQVGPTRLRLVFGRVAATIDRFWSANFAHKKYSLPLINLALAGAMLLALAQGPGFAADWEHEVRSFLGFSGLLLLDISFGLAGYLFLNDRWV